MLLDRVIVDLFEDLLEPDSVQSIFFSLADTFLVRFAQVILVERIFEQCSTKSHIKNLSCIHSDKYGGSLMVLPTVKQHVFLFAALTSSPLAQEADENQIACVFALETFSDIAGQRS